MANTYRVTHAFEGSGGTAKDQYVNSFHFFSATHAPVDVETWGPALVAAVHYLWTTVSGGNSVGDFYHTRCRNDLGYTKVYDVTTSETAGSPIFQMTDQALLPAADYVEPDTDIPNLPEEVAVCLSYEAIHTGGNLPRRRGRIYLGPFNCKALEGWPTAETYAPTRVSAMLQQSILGGAVGMQDSLDTYGFEWRVFSKMDGFAFKIVRFSVDNAFDTVRGRGGVASNREFADIL